MTSGTRIYCLWGGLACAMLVGLGAGWYWLRNPLRAAEVAYDAGRWSLAAQEALSCLESRPGLSDARLLAARSFMQMGRWEEAEEQFAQLQQLSGRDKEDWALVLTRLGRLPEAANLYQEMYEERPDDPERIQQLVAALIPLNKLERAIELCERLAEFPAHRSAAHYGLGTVYMQKSEFAAALTYFEGLLQDDPELNDPVMQRRVFWEDYATALLRLGRLDEAEQVLERALVLHRSAEILDLLGQLYESRRDADRAVYCWLQALAESESYLPALRSLARLELLRDHPEKSIEYLLRVLDFAPFDIAAHLNLAVAYERAGQHEQAAIFHTRANQLRRLQNLKELLAAQVEGNFNSPEAQLLVAIRDMEENRLAEAETRVAKILRAFPDFAPAQKLRETLSGIQ